VIDPAAKGIAIAHFEVPALSREGQAIQMFQHLRGWKRPWSPVLTRPEVSSVEVYFTLYAWNSCHF
jgi:hypothetical protein